VLMAVDIGNTRMCVGFADDYGRIVRRDFVLTRGPLLQDLPKLIANETVTDAAVASVAPDANAAVEQAIRSACGKSALFIPRDLPYPVPIDVDEPDRVGPDRVMLAAAVKARGLAGAIVVSIGTAVTVNVIGEGGRFRGGAIAPGPGMAARALHQQTSLLPDITPSIPTFALGRNTEDAIRTGTTYGIAGMIDRLVVEMNRNVRGTLPILCTGGAAPLVAPLCETLKDITPDLVLEGIVETYRAAKGIAWKSSVKKEFEV
jgi:type III pantothenate kinase